MKYDAIIIGAGLAGLSAAKTLEAAGLSYLVLESSDRVGGRVKTDVHEGFLLDHGFQVLLTSYPEAIQMLDYDKLALSPFYKGALVWNGQLFEKVADPFEYPLEALKTLNNGIGSFGDKFRVAKLRTKLLQQSEYAYRESTEMSTRTYLNKQGFSDRMIEKFFRPFFSGIFLEPDLNTSSRMFEFVFRTFAKGQTVLPAQGMQAIPQQLADSLRPGRIRLKAKVRSLTKNWVYLDSGELLPTSAVIIATDGFTASQLLPSVPACAFNQVHCFYFEAAEPPVREPILVLNGSQHAKVINNLCVPNLVASSYAPSGKYLISVSSLYQTNEPKVLTDQVRLELTEMFGPAVSDWKFLKSYCIRKALPRFTFPQKSLQTASVKHGDGLFLCGDHTDTPSINGALYSGRQVAEALLTEHRMGTFSQHAV